MRTRIGVIFFVMVLAVSFGMARAHPFGDAGLSAQPPAEKPLMDGAAIPAEVRTILTGKCADCHSTRSRMPIYGKLAPVS